MSSVMSPSIGSFSSSSSSSSPQQTRYQSQIQEAYLQTSPRSHPTSSSISRQVQTSNVVPTSNPTNTLASTTQNVPENASAGVSSPRLKRSLDIEEGAQPVVPPAVPSPQIPPISEHRNSPRIRRSLPTSGTSSPRIRNSPSLRRQAAENNPTTPQTQPNTNSTSVTSTEGASLDPLSLASPSKRARPRDPAKKLVPRNYQQCSMSDLVILISDMLSQLVTLNDGIPLTHGGLTRFHSRAPPAISIIDYLHRIALHTTLEPSTLLSMVYYIDLLSNHYPAFTISSLTVHRFLITAAAVASKGLCDQFCTNTFYARVGGVSVRELNVLETEFLVRVGWRIVPQAEILREYYASLVRRMGEGWGFEENGDSEETEGELSSSSSIISLSESSTGGASSGSEYQANAAD